MADDTTPKELLVSILPRVVAVLVPKRRGTGYAKVPLGHHYNELSEISYDIGYDIFGLDGHLEIQVGTRFPEDDVPKIMEPIARHYGWPYRLIPSDEFFRLHPVKTADSYETSFFR